MPFEFKRTVAGVRAAIERMKAEPGLMDSLRSRGTPVDAEAVLMEHAAHAELELGHAVEGTAGRPDEEWLVELAEIAGRACDLVREKRSRP
ncbi:MAG: hypothetical protein ABIQ16_05650 [Polyangiaceae bacterium]